MSGGREMLAFCSAWDDKLCPGCLAQELALQSPRDVISAVALGQWIASGTLWVIFRFFISFLWSSGRRPWGPLGNVRVHVLLESGLHKRSGAQLCAPSLMPQAQDDTALRAREGPGTRRQACRARCDFCLEACQSLPDKVSYPVAHNGAITTAVPSECSAAASALALGSQLSPCLTSSSGGLSWRAAVWRRGWSVRTAAERAALADQAGGMQADRPQSPTLILFPPRSRQAGSRVTSPTITRGDSSSPLGATTSSAVETVERVREARTEASLAVSAGEDGRVGGLHRGWGVEAAVAVPAVEGRTGAAAWQWLLLSVSASC
ncbi:hypothetical protein SKAU_G00130020 [Synaphobranchus kaupii]|uniref:Uncharacterized protein n=1 Tax=Synaphobranchus kaupii TaxID=118154 RepID=A0A9Q1FQS2_SYNKA|nr:hypothetical protein SKAU_G00130020 [Synaphobranchus kaupii]